MPCGWGESPDHSLTHSLIHVYVRASETGIDKLTNEQTDERMFTGVNIFNFILIHHKRQTTNVVVSC